MPFMSSLIFSEEVPPVSYQLVTELLLQKNLRKDVDIAALELK